MNDIRVRTGREAGGISVPWEVAVVVVRETLGHHFDVVVVIWVLALALGWSMVTLSHANLRTDQWSTAPQNGPAWVIQSEPSN